jgi:hypothetical protein
MRSIFCCEKFYLASRIATMNHRLRRTLVLSVILIITFDVIARNKAELLCGSYDEAILHLRNVSIECDCFVALSSA